MAALEGVTSQLYWLPLDIPGTVATVQALSNSLGGPFAVDAMAVSVARDEL